MQPPDWSFRPVKSAAAGARVSGEHAEPTGKEELQGKSPRGPACGDTAIFLAGTMPGGTSGDPDAMASWCCACAADGGGERGQGVWGRHAPIKVFQKEVPSILSVSLSSPPLRAMPRGSVTPLEGGNCRGHPGPRFHYQSESERLGPTIEVSARRKAQDPEETYGPV